MIADSTSVVTIEAALQQHVKNTRHNARTYILTYEMTKKTKAAVGSLPGLLQHRQLLDKNYPDISRNIFKNFAACKICYSFLYSTISRGTPMMFYGNLVGKHWSTEKHRDNLLV